VCDGQGTAMVAGGCERCRRRKAPPAAPDIGLRARGRRKRFKGGGQRTACAAVTRALSTLQLQFAARMQGARDASAGSEAMRAHCRANRKEKRRCRGSDSRQKPKNQARCALPLGLLVPHLGCPAAARHDAGNEHVGGEEGEDRRRDGRAQDQGGGFLGGGNERRQEPEAREEAAEAATARKTTGVLLLRKFNADAERSS
jgi:hypothetical protein